MKRGAILVDDDDPGTTPRLLFYLEHAVQDGRRTRSGEFLTISKRLQFVEVASDGVYRQAGSAPYPDYRPATTTEQGLIASELDAEWLQKDWDHEVMRYAIAEVVPKHVTEVKAQRLAQIDRVERQVKARLTREVTYWDRRAQDLTERERAGKPTRLPAQVAEDRADKLTERLQNRLAELQKERHIMPGTPQVKGGALIMPRGLLEQRQGRQAVSLDDSVDAAARQRVEQIAMEAVMAAERALGREPRDVSDTKGLGYDIESRTPAGSLIFIEVKGRVQGADQVTLTTNEIRRANNVPESFRLALVLVEREIPAEVVYVCDFEYGQPGFAQTAASYHLQSLVHYGGPPR